MAVCCTQANTGVLLCYHGDDAFAADLCGFLQAKDPTVRLLQWPSGMDLGLLPTVARGGMTVEVGPLAHSTVDSKSMHVSPPAAVYQVCVIHVLCIVCSTAELEVLSCALPPTPLCTFVLDALPLWSPRAQRTMDLITDSLDYIHRRNDGSIEGGQGTGSTVFASLAGVDYPRGDDGEISAFIHEDLQVVTLSLPEV